MPSTNIPPRPNTRYPARSTPFTPVSVRAVGDWNHATIYLGKVLTAHCARANQLVPWYGTAISTISTLRHGPGKPKNRRVFSRTEYMSAMTWVKIISFARVQPHGSSASWGRDACDFLLFFCWDTSQQPRDCGRRTGMVMIRGIIDS